MKIYVLTERNFLKVLLLLHPTPPPNDLTIFAEKTNTIKLCFQPRNLTAFL